MDLVDALHDQVLYGGRVLTIEQWHAALSSSWTRVAVLMAPPQSMTGVCQIADHHRGLWYLFGTSEMTVTGWIAIVDPSDVVDGIRLAVKKLRSIEVAESRRRLGKEPSFAAELTARTQAERAVRQGVIGEAWQQWLDHICVRHLDYLATVRRKIIEFFCLMSCDVDQVPWVGRVVTSGTADIQQCYSFREMCAVAERTVRELQPHVLGRWVSEPEQSGANGAAPLVLRALSWLRQQHQDPVLPGDCAQALGVSLPQLARQFRRDTGVTLGDCLRSLRVATAKDLLSHSQDDILTIALACGFNGPDQFARNFRAQVGMPPQRWRQHAALG